jgi:hypothetical protein
MEDRTSNFYLINSYDRITGVAENCTVNNQNFNDSFSFRVSKVFIPFTFYNITSNNNILKILSGVTTYTITVPVGQYTITQLLSNLTTQLNALSVGTFTVTAGATSYMITITNASTQFQYLGTQSTINKVLGFTATNTTLALTTTGTLIYNLGGTDWIDIISRTLTNSESKSRTTNNSGSNILIRIPTSEFSFGQTIFFQGFTPHQWSWRMNLEEAIDLQLVDQYGNQLDLNGRDYSITLKFHSHKSNNPGNMDRTYLRDHNKVNEGYFIN